MKRRQQTSNAGGAPRKAGSGLSPVARTVLRGVAGVGLGVWLGIAADEEAPPAPPVPGTAAQSAAPEKPAWDEITVKGDTLKGRVLNRGEKEIIFRTIYGEGELRIPNDRVEKLKIAGQEQPLPGHVTPPPPPPPPAEETISTASPEGVSAQIEETKEIQAAWIGEFHRLIGLRRCFQTQEWLDKKLGLRLGLAYTSLGLGAGDTLGGDRGSAGGDFDFFGRWHVWGRESGNAGTLGFNLRDRHAYTDAPPSQLGRRVGSLWPVTGGFSDAGFAVTQAYLDQYFLDRNLQFRVGEIFLDQHFDTYSYRSAKSFFLNSAFSDNPAVAFPDHGAGFATLVKPAPDWHFITGGGNTRRLKLEDGLRPLARGENLFSGMEIGWHPSRGKLKGHSLAVFGWYVPGDRDRALPDGDGIAVTYEWHPEKACGLFARYAFSGSAATAVRHLGTSGIVWTEPFGRPLDRLGVAFGWGTPAATDHDGQGVVELFYRWQFTPLWQISPDLQLLISPTYNPDQSLILIFGVRARLAL
jgi:porin